MPPEPGSAESDSSRLCRVEEFCSGSAPAALLGAREMLLEYGRFVQAHVGACHLGSLEEEAQGLPGNYHRQGGGCLLAWYGNVTSGFVAWRPLPASTGEAAWEMKRLWVKPAARGLRLGHILTQAILDRASAAKQNAVLLDTVPQAMPAAHRIYLKLGFTPCEPYNANSTEGVIWLRKRLSSF